MARNVRDIKSLVAESRDPAQRGAAGPFSPSVDLRCQTPAGGFQLDGMLGYIDATYINDWLLRTAALVNEVQEWWGDGDNAVDFSHFWLSELSDEKRRELLELEVGLLKAEVELAFRVGMESGTVGEKDIFTLFRAVLSEYPRVVTEDNGRSFLDIVSVLAQEKHAAFRDLLSRIRCATTNATHTQWLLAIRSFALITLSSAVVTFFRNFCDSEAAAGTPRPGSVQSPRIASKAIGGGGGDGGAAAAAAAAAAAGAAGAAAVDYATRKVQGLSLADSAHPTAALSSSSSTSHAPSSASASFSQSSYRPSTSSSRRPGTSQLLARPGTAGGFDSSRPTTAVASRTHVAAVDEFFGAVKLGHVDVVQRMLARGVQTEDLVDGLGRTPLLAAVVHRRAAVVELLLKQHLCDVNRPASSGNTPLHVAVNMGDAVIVRLLVAAGADVRAINEQCAATPYDMAVLHGNQDVIDALTAPPSF